MMTQPLVVTSPAGPTDVDPEIQRPSTGSVGCSAVLPSLAGVSTTEWSPSSRAAPVDQSSVVWFVVGGESAGRTLPPASLTPPRPTGASPHVGELDADGGCSRGPF